MKRKIALGLVALLAVIQFIRPQPNEGSPRITENDISRTYAIPADVHQLLVEKCYDCHSNTTIYPWYYHIQPIGWWVSHHIDEGKQHLNFSDFRNYSAKKAAHKMEELSDAIDNGWMPLDSYVWMHHEAEVNDEDRQRIYAWMKTVPIGYEP